jgi:nucleotide-binding universal stress UspA family protein
MQNIILGYDGSESARRALERVAELASGASVTVVAAVHVMPQFGRAPLQIDPEEIDERRRELHEAKAALEAKGIETHAVEAHGDPAEAILEAAEKAGADLVVVGTRGANIASRVLLGSVSTKVVHEAPCDVLVVR